LAGTDKLAGVGALDQKIVLVTGASRGIGAETARLHGRAGAHVVINYRDKARRAEQVVQEIGAARAIAVQADLTDPAQVSAMVDRVREAHGRLDVLVLNASGGMERDADPGYALRLNRDAQVDVVTRAAELMPAGSRVVFVTSHQAHFHGRRPGAIPTVEQFAAEVAADVPAGHTVYIGGADYLSS
jgi:3-oxoacyl-[acyl-carrier protein] reductase